MFIDDDKYREMLQEIQDLKNENHELWHEVGILKFDNAELNRSNAKLNEIIERLFKRIEDQK